MVWCCDAYMSASRHISSCYYYYGRIYDGTFISRGFVCLSFHGRAPCCGGLCGWRKASMTVFVSMTLFDSTLCWRRIFPHILRARHTGHATQKHSHTQSHANTYAGIPPTKRRSTDVLVVIRCTKEGRKYQKDHVHRERNQARHLGGYQGNGHEDRLRRLPWDGTSPTRVGVCGMRKGSAMESHVANSVKERLAWRPNTRDIK